MTSSLLPRASALTAILLFVACGGSTSPSHEAYGNSQQGVRFETYDSPEAEADDDYREVVTTSAAREIAPSDLAASAPIARPQADMKVDAAGAGGDGSSASNQQTQTPPPDDSQKEEASEPQGRMVYYSGHARLRVTKPTDMVERAIQIVKEKEGFVEQRSDTHVTLRVPVADFELIFDQLLELGDVDDHSVSAQDITDRYTAIELRLRVLTASRDRLMELLKKAKTEQEKLSLLSQIKRLTEQIDSLQIESSTLKSLADYSRIHLQFVPRSQMPSGAVHEPVTAFRWIYRISPFAATAVTDEQDYIEFVTPQGFVLFDEDDERWRAESANGAVIWAYARPNEPLGDSKFWHDTIDHRLTKTYESGSHETIGSYEVLKLLDGSRQSYRFWVAVRAVEDELHVVQVYFPTEDHQKRFEAAVREAFTAAKGGH